MNKDTEKIKKIILQYDIANGYEAKKLAEELTAYIKQREREAYDKGWEERWSHEIGKLIKGIDKNLQERNKDENR